MFRAVFSNRHTVQSVFSVVKHTVIVVWGEIMAFVRYRELFVITAQPLQFKLSPVFLIAGGN